MELIRLGLGLFCSIELCNGHALQLLKLATTGFATFYSENMRIDNFILYCTGVRVGVLLISSGKSNNGIFDNLVFPFSPVVTTVDVDCTGLVNKVKVAVLSVNVTGNLTGKLIHRSGFACLYESLDCGGGEVIVVHLSTGFTGKYIGVDHFIGFIVLLVSTGHSDRIANGNFILPFRPVGRAIHLKTACTVLDPEITVLGIDVAINRSGHFVVSLSIGCSNELCYSLFRGIGIIRCVAVIVFCFTVKGIQICASYRFRGIALVVLEFSINNDNVVYCNLVVAFQPFVATQIRKLICGELYSGSISII